MRIKNLAKLSLALMPVAAVWIGAATSACAQVEGPPMTWLQLRNQDVRPSIVQLFKEMNVPYSIAPEIQGKITLDLGQATCDAALRRVLHEVDATYRVQDGIYEVIPNQVDIIFPNYGQKAENIVTNHLRFMDEDVRDAASEILKAYGKAYTITPEVQGRVTLDVENATLDWALKRILRQVNATFSVQAGEYEIVRMGFARNTAGLGQPNSNDDVERAASSRAQTEDEVIKVVAFQRKDVGEALRKLFREVRVPFWIAPDIQGKVTVDLFKVPFHIALQNVLVQADASCRVVDGIYEVVPRPVEVIAPGASDKPEPSIHVRFIKEDVRDAVRELFNASGKSYSIIPEIDGNVTLEIENATLDTALRSVLAQTNAKYVIESGVYEIVPAQPDGLGIPRRSDGTKSEASARAQIQNQNVKEVNFQQTDVRIALRQLFRQMHVPFSIAPEIQGSVTIMLKNVTFDIALQNILRQVDATYRVDAGVFEVIMRQVETNYSGFNEQPAASNHFRFLNEDVREAIREVIDGIGKPFSIAPEVQGRITMDLDNASYELALRLILQQAGANCRIEGGVYRIVRSTHGPHVTEPDPTDFDLLVDHSHSK